MVMDSRIKTEYGSILKFERLTDNSSVVATPYSWWISGGSGSSQVVTINPGGFVPEDYFTWVMRSANRNVNFEAGDHKFYCENIRWIAGDNSGLTPFNGTENSVFAAVNCSFENAYVNDGLRVQGVGTSISIRCTAQNNSKDGFNYHNGVNTSTDTIQVHFLEVDCVGFDNMETLGTGNGSTAHESCVGIRLNCNYGFNGGPGLVDIGNVMSYNINCTSHNNNGDGNATGVQADNDAQMWLHGGHYGLNRTTDLLAKSSSTIYLCDTRYGSLDFASGIAQFVDFLPESGN